MPRFPSSERYDSQRQLTTQQPNAFSEQTPVNGKILEATAAVTQNLQNVTIKYAEALESARNTQSDVNFNTKQLDINARAEGDPDYNAYNKYAKEVDENYREATKGLRPGSEQSLKLQYKAAEEKIKLQGVFKKKVIDNDRANVISQIELETSNPTSKSIPQIESILNEKIRTGAFSREEAYKISEKAKKDIKFNSFVRDLEVDAGFAGERLKGNEYGFDINELEKARSIQEKAEKRQEELNKQFQSQTVSDLGEKLAKRELTFEEVDNAILTGAIDAEMGLNYQLALAGPEQWSEFASEVEQGMKSKIMTDALEKLDSNDSDKRIEIVDSALKNYNDKKMNSDDLSFILRVAAGKNKEPQNPIWGFLKTAVSKIQESPNLSKLGARVVDKFKSAWDMQQDPRPIMDNAIESVAKEDNPETANFDVGKEYSVKGHNVIYLGVDKDGKQRFKLK